jgi:hypothetical protein
MISNTPESQPETSQIIEINHSQKWEVYYRLQELQITCQCASDRPLQAQCHHTKDLIQIWSVIQQATANRHKLVDWLESCWKISL